MKIQFKKLSLSTIVPTYAHEHDAGLDLYSDVSTRVAADQSKMIPTGVGLAIPAGYCGIIRPRSGLARRFNITCISSGVIDSGYRGELLVQLFNLGVIGFNVNQGDKIAQLLIIPIVHAELEEVNDLPTSQRGQKAFGSSG